MKKNKFILLLLSITTLARAEIPSNPYIYDSRILRTFCDIVEASLSQTTREFDKQGKAIHTGKCNNAVLAKYRQEFAGLGVAADGTLSTGSIHDKSAYMMVSTMMKVITEKRDDFETFRYFNGIQSKMKEQFVTDFIGQPLLKLISSMAGKNPNDTSALNRYIADLIPENKLNLLEEVAAQIIKDESK